MTIIVQCDCGRTLRAPNQMAGKLASCVCGNSVPLVKEDVPRKFDVLEPEFAEADEGEEEAPLMPRPASQKMKKKRGGKSLFRPSQGQYVERGEEEAAPTAPLPEPQKRKKRRQDKVTSDERKRQISEGFVSGLFRSLKFPIRVESLLTIGGMAIAYGVFTSLARFLPFGVLGLYSAVGIFAGTMLILGFFLFFLLQIFRLASIDEDDLPLALEFDMDLIRQDLWLWLGTLWWCGVPFAVYWWVTNWLGGVGRTLVGMGAILSVCLFLFPMALMSTALHLSVLAANPWSVLQSIRRVIVEYLSTFAVFGTLCGTVVAIGWALPPYPAEIPVFSHVGMWVLLFYALTASAYGFGNFYYRNRRKIGWFEELPKQI